ncbi:MAG: hypothetical protein IJ093_02535 [Bacilli bacterium]|nr:hypothetical protein [Bacilli bacterium]
MKVLVNEKIITLFLNKLYIKNVDFENKETIEKYIKQVLNKLQNSYDLQFGGYYEMMMFIDDNYGIIINIKKEELEYLDYFTNKIEFNTKVEKDNFLYEVSNVDSNMKKSFIIYKNLDKIYLQAKNKKTNLEEILEHIQKIIYGKESYKILKKAKIVR